MHSKLYQKTLQNKSEISDIYVKNYIHLKLEQAYKINRKYPTYFEDKFVPA